MKDRDCNILNHILEYCKKLKTYTDGMSYKEFMESELCMDACALCILQIGELVYNLTDEFKEKNNKIPWRQIRAMRNIVAHHYGSVDSETVWDVIESDIPVLSNYCKEIMQSMNEN